MVISPYQLSAISKCRHWFIFQVLKVSLQCEIITIKKINSVLWTWYCGMAFPSLCPHRSTSAITLCSDTREARKKMNYCRRVHQSNQNKILKSRIFPSQLLSILFISPFVASRATFSFHLDIVNRANQLYQTYTQAPFSLTDW